MVMADGLQRDSHHCVVEVEPICLGAHTACVVPILHGTMVCECVRVLLLL